MITVRPSVVGDFERLAGSLPPYRVKAWTAETDGAVVGIGGVTYLPNGTAMVFIDMTDEASAYPITLHRTARLFLATLRSDGLQRVVAEAHPDKAQAGRWLERLGFHRIDGDHEGRSLYACDL